MDEKENRARLKTIQREFTRRKWTITHLMRVSGLSYPTCWTAIRGYRIPYGATLDRLEKSLGILEKVR